MVGVSQGFVGRAYHERSASKDGNNAEFISP